MIDINVYNPYDITYGDSIVQNIMFYDSTSKQSFLVNDEIKTLLPNTYFYKTGFNQFSFSLSSKYEMDNLPIRDNCIINLSPEQLSKMTQVEQDYYYHKEKKRCINDFLYAQNKTYQFLAFLKVAYNKFSILFGKNYNYFVPFNNKWLNIETGLIYNELINNDKENVFFTPFHSRYVDEFNGSITDNYYFDISVFLNTIDFFKMKFEDYKIMIDNTIENFNRYPIDITINEDTGLPYNQITNLSLLHISPMTVLYKTYKNQISFIYNQYFIEKIDGVSQWVFSGQYINKSNEDYTIRTNYNNFIFFDDTGTVLYLLQPFDFDLSYTTETKEYFGRPDTQINYIYSIDNVYFTIKVFILPDFDGIVNNESPVNLSIIDEYKEKPITKCCLAECFGITN